MRHLKIQSSPLDWIIHVLSLSGTIKLKLVTLISDILTGMIVSSAFFSLIQGFAILVDYFLELIDGKHGEYKEMRRLSWIYTY